MKQPSLAKQRHSESRLGRKLPQELWITAFNVLIAPDLLCFFRRPNVTWTLTDNLSVEIKNLQGSPGLSYIRFYNKNGHIFMPKDLQCIDLDAGSIVGHMTDFNNNPAYVLSDASWCALCSKERVLAYIHATGTICLPNEVVWHFFFCLRFIFRLIHQLIDPISSPWPGSVELQLLASSPCVKCGKPVTHAVLWVAYIILFQFAVSWFDGKFLLILVPGILSCGTVVV